jgi:hypothetical protein
MTSLEFADALQFHGYSVERSGQGRITLVRSGDHRRVCIPSDQELCARSLRFLLLAAEVDEASFERTTMALRDTIFSDAPQRSRNAA